MDAVILAVVSGKGGTGKSTTSVFVGAALAAQGKKVVLVELASALRSVDIIAGIADRVVFDIEDVLSGRTPPSKAVVASPVYPGLDVIPAPYVGGQIVAESLQLLCARFRPHYDFIILDVAAGYGRAFRAAAVVAHRVLLVETPDPVALRDGRTLVDMMRDSAVQLRLVLNRVNPKTVLESNVLNDLDEAIDIVGVQLIGVIPDSAAILQAAAGGEPLVPGGREDRVYAAIAKRILGEEVPLVVQ